VPTHPSRTTAHLPQADIACIRRLSTRVNVLPVIARADTLTDARIAAVKLAVRRDLADAGIGFGIFDDGAAPPPVQAHDDRNRGRSPSVGTTQLPYALVSPEMYSHSDGVLKNQPARHELIQQYAPAQTAGNRTLQRGKFVRNFRWGGLDVMEPRHSDFVPLRSAVFQHMEVILSFCILFSEGC
jgi:septin family protein